MALFSAIASADIYPALPHFGTPRTSPSRLQEAGKPPQKECICHLTPFSSQWNSSQWNCFRLHITRPTKFSSPLSSRPFNAMSKPIWTPTLASKHSGIPERLQKEADSAKQRTYSLKTLPNSVARRAPLRLPPDTSQDKFDLAIAALQKCLGKDGIELNDKPLVDGWYMEHP